MSDNVPGDEAKQDRLRRRRERDRLRRERETPEEKDARFVKSIAHVCSHNRLVTLSVKSPLILFLISLPRTVTLHSASHK